MFRVSPENTVHTHYLFRYVGRFDRAIFIPARAKDPAHYLCKANMDELGGPSRSNVSAWKDIGMPWSVVSTK
ncbi:hypothetical protein THTE_2943 [Thermogutta terrifontis]|uniref:Uncharacterized protein n=1 Tax=Thermogutta terrifontis TaxID=1331910 RepID=A0A286RHV3_9BACT|nr:hypothetical protein THTE_2943 [Thermogutta terrifontis]